MLGVEVRGFLHNPTVISEMRWDVILLSLWECRMAESLVQV